VPAQCRWCDQPGIDIDVRDALKWSDIKLAQDFSNGAAILSPTAAFGLLALAEGSQRSGARYLDDALPVAEATVANLLLHHLVKFTVGRERPFVHFAAPGRTPATDDDMSFYSGHTSTTFAIAAAAGTVAHLRGYKLEPEIWAAGLTLAAATGYFRIAGDKHYFTDVMTGAVVGSAIGVAVPMLFDHYLKDSGTTVVPAGKVVLLSGVF